MQRRRPFRQALLGARRVVQPPGDPAAQSLHDLPLDLGLVVEHAPERLTGEDEEPKRRRRRDRRRPRDVLDKGDLAEEVTRPERPDRLAVLRHVGLSLDDDEKLPARLSLAAEHLPGGDVEVLRHLRERRELATGESREQRCLAERLRLRIVAEERHGMTLLEPARQAQRVRERTGRPGPVARFGFPGVAELRDGLLLPVGNEHRVVPEPFGPARLGRDATLERAARGDLAAVRTERNEFADVPRPAAVASDPVEAREQQVEVLRVGRVLTGEPRRPDARLAAEPVDHEAGVLTADPVDANHMVAAEPGLEARVLEERRAGLLRGVRVRLERQNVPAGQDRAELARLVVIARGEDEPHSSQRTAWTSSRPASASVTARFPCAMGRSTSTRSRRYRSSSSSSSPLMRARRPRRNATTSEIGWPGGSSISSTPEAPPKRFTASSTQRNGPSPTRTIAVVITAATTQSPAAVVRPRTERPWRRMAPAPRKPMPVTTWAAIRVGSNAVPRERSKMKSPQA